MNPAVKMRKVLRLDSVNEAKIIEEHVQGKKRKEKTGLMSALPLVWDLGFAISLPIVGGAFLGQIVDEKFDSSPRMTLSFIFLGLGVSIAYIYNLVKEMRKS